MTPSHVLVEGHITDIFIGWFNPTLSDIRIETLRVNVHGQEVTCECARKRGFDHANDENK